MRNADYRKNRHSCYMLEYHLVVVTKYRHPVLIGALKDRLLEITDQILNEQWKCRITKMNTDADHVHILFEADPFTAPGELAGVVKTQTSRFVRKAYGETILKKYYWKPYFWSGSYFVTTVSENSLSKVKEYVKNQKGDSPTTNT